eukprot:1141667-Pelagomonas_calceolata.AAC.3
MKQSSSGLLQELETLCMLAQMLGCADGCEGKMLGCVDGCEVEAGDVYDFDGDELLIAMDTAALECCKEVEPCWARPYLKISVAAAAAAAEA